MPAISQFTLIKPIRVFDTIWTEEALTEIASDGEYVEVGETKEQLPAGRAGMPWPTPLYRATDIWGIEWSFIPEADWGGLIAESYQEIERFSVVYLRFTVTVYNGLPGDSMLFLFNQPNTLKSRRLHAAVHVEIGPRVENTPAHRATAVEQHLIGGWNLTQCHDGEEALKLMQSTTEVRFLGLSRQDKISVRAQCDLLGGMY